jgi:hypothetical protein
MVGLWNSKRALDSPITPTPTLTFNKKPKLSSEVQYSTEKSDDGASDREAIIFFGPKPSEVSKTITHVSKADQANCYQPIPARQYWPKPGRVEAGPGSYFASRFGELLEDVVDPQRVIPRRVPETVRRIAKKVSMTPAWVLRTLRSYGSCARILQTPKLTSRRMH